MPISNVIQAECQKQTTTQYCSVEQVSGRLKILLTKRAIDHPTPSALRQLGKDECLRAGLLLCHFHVADSN